MTETIPKSQDITLLYRVENPNISRKPDGVTSHADIIGGWFSPDPDKALGLYYLRKSTRTLGRDSVRVPGARLLVAFVPNEDVDGFHASLNPTVVGNKLEHEPEDYVLPRDGSVPIIPVDLDPYVDQGERARMLGNPEVLWQIRREVMEHVGQVVTGSQIEKVGS